MYYSKALTTKARFGATDILCVLVKKSDLEIGQGLKAHELPLNPSLGNISTMILRCGGLIANDMLVKSC